MNIYFSCSITGGRQDQGVYLHIVDHLTSGGHHVPTAHLSHADGLDEEKNVDPLSVYQRDVKWVEDCDVLIAEVSTPSHGVGYEIALALFLGKPVLCCWREGAIVSKMLTGNTHAKFQAAAYLNDDELAREIDQFLEKYSC
jgi:nucleoside 2-deoxyribosyltransferase